MLLVLSFAPKRFFPATPFFPLSSNNKFPNSSQVDEEPLSGCSTLKSLLASQSTCWRHCKYHRYHYLNTWNTWMSCSAGRFYTHRNFLNQKAIFSNLSLWPRRMFQYACTSLGPVIFQESISPRSYTSSFLCHKEKTLWFIYLNVSLSIRLALRVKGEEILDGRGGEGIVSPYRFSLSPQGTPVTRATWSFFF